MARDINRRLQALNTRRMGTDRIGELSFDSAQQVLAKSSIAEAYTKRAPNQNNTRYALGSMQAVDSDYTRISIEEAERVGAQLQSGLDKKSIGVEFRLQGSVACDVHIRGVSDVDLLAIESRFYRYDTTGVRALRNEYNHPVTYDTLQELLQLRREAETILVAAYPKATVKTSGSKAINLTGGSLRRPVDVVPANWYDTPDYQNTGSASDRGVEILDKSIPKRILNMPFRHIHRINQRDSTSLGGLKKTIRLCKNVKADAIDEGTKIAFSSFDIAATLWHSDINALTVGVANELAILAEATRFLDYLARRKDYAKTLDVPDGTRKIFDSEEKLEGLVLLSMEMDDLAEKVSREQAKLIESVSLRQDQIVDYLRKAHIPG
jgi:hypothetical protein